MFFISWVIFVWEASKKIFAYRRRIHCKKIFAVPGNHDKQARKLKVRILLARQSGGSFDSRPIDRALSLRPARLEPVQSRIMAPLWSFSRMSSRGTELTLHGCGSRHTRFPTLAV